MDAEKVEPAAQAGPKRKRKKEPWILAPQLRALIRELGYESIREAAAAIPGTGPGKSFPEQQLHHILNGWSQPRRSTLDRILRGLGATHDDLLRARPVPQDRHPRPGPRPFTF
jgi:hypothetical protein